MENNDTNTDYHKFVRVGDQKWEIVEITIGIIFFFFFCLRYVFTIFYTGSFQVPPKKNHPPPKVPIPTHNTNLTKVAPIWTFWRMAQPPNHPWGEGGGVRTMDSQHPIKKTQQNFWFLPLEDFPHPLTLFGKPCMLYQMWCDQYWQIRYNWITRKDTCRHASKSPK